MDSGKEKEKGGMATSTNGQESQDARRDRVLRKLRRIIKDIVATFKAEKGQSQGILSVDEASRGSDKLHMENVVATLMNEMIKPRQKYGEAQTYHISSWLRKHGKHERQELHELQLAQLKECFELMDTDKGGSIDEDELKECFKLLGINMSRAEAKAMFDEVDGDGSGAIEYDEFVDLMTNVFDSGRHGDDKVAGSFESFQLASSSYRRARLLNSLIGHDFEETQEMIQKYKDFKENEIKMQKKTLRQAADKRAKLEQLNKERDNIEYGEYERRIEAGLPKYMRPSLDLDTHRNQLAKAILPVLIRQGYSGYLPDVTAGSLASFKEVPGHMPSSLVLSPRGTTQGTSSFKSPRDNSLPNSPRPNYAVPRRTKMRMQRSGGLDEYESPRLFFYTTLEHTQGRSADSSHESLSREFGTRSIPRSINEAESLMRSSSGSYLRATDPAAEISLAEGISSQRSRDQKRRISTTPASLPSTPRSSSVVEHAAGKQQNTSRTGSSFSGYTPRGKFKVCGGGFRHGHATPRQARSAQQTPRNLSQRDYECEDQGGGRCLSERGGKEHSSTSKLEQHVGRNAAGQGFRSKAQKHPKTAPSSSTSFSFCKLQLDDIPERSFRRQHPQTGVARPGDGRNEKGCDGNVLPDLKNAASVGLEIPGNRSAESVSKTLHLGENKQQSPRSIPMFRALPPCDIWTVATGETKMRDAAGCRPDFVPRLNFAVAGSALNE